MGIEQQELSAALEAVEQLQQSSPEPAVVSPAQAPYGDGLVELPLGLYDPLQGVIDVAEVRELNGYDEEAYSKLRSKGAAVGMILERATVRIGDDRATKKMLSALSVGDRIELFIAIRTLTWGDVVEASWTCSACSYAGQVEVSLALVPRTQLDDKVSERVRTLTLASGRSVKVRWPSGTVQTKIMLEPNLTGAEVTTAVVQDTVEEIDGMPLLGEDAAKALSVRDRTEIMQAVYQGFPGPRLEQAWAPCPECGERIEVPLSVGDLFPF